MVRGVMKLRARPLGATGVDVSPLALGTVKLGRNTGVRYPAAFELPDDKQVRRLLEMAHAYGIRLIDTAPAYGASEERLGQLLPGRREDWLICTKAGESWENGTSRFDFSADAIRGSVERSLRRLRTDYLDVVLLHSDGHDLDILNQSGAIESLQRLKERGSVRLIGMSTKTVKGGLAALAVSDVLMVTLNPSDTSQLPVIEAAEQGGQGILLKKVFDSGHADPADCLAFALATPGVSSAVIGTINEEHLANNVSIALKLLDDA